MLPMKTNLFLFPLPSLVDSLKEKEKKNNKNTITEKNKKTKKITKQTKN